MLADVQMQAGQAAQAVISARQAHDLHPFDTRATILLADAQLAAGDKEGAITTLIGLVAAQPKLVSAYMRLAAAYAANDAVDKAAATVVDALKVDPTNLAARALLGEIFMRKGRLDDALALASEIQKNRPKAPLGYKMEGDVLMARKDFLRAADAFQKAASFEPSVAMLVRIHQAQSAAQGGYANDVALRNWIANHPDDTEARLYLTDALSGAGRYRDAIDLGMEVLKRIPQSAQAFNNLAWALYAAGDDRALDYARQAVKLDPKNAATVDTLGWILFGRGNTVEGVQTLLNAVALDGADPTIRYHLAQALIKVGDVGRARTELKAVINSGKPFPQLNEAKGLLARLGS
jgi:putative PEP-CTERM system TPR-repeat lipoprotein